MTTTTLTTTPARPSWATHVDTFSQDAGAFCRTITFGTYCDGSPRCVDVMQYFGGGVLKRGHDRTNNWRNGRPGVSIVVSQEDDPAVLRRAAAAILEAADLIEATR